VSDLRDFSPLELDALQEYMNIGFGQAAAALSEVIDMHVVLSVPKISSVAADRIEAFIREEVEEPESFCLVEQFFFGRFSGTGFLLLPERESEKLVSLFGAESEAAACGLSLDSLEREVVIEIGNIIIGACVGKIAEMLDDVVSYQPPRFYPGPVDSRLIAGQFGSGNALALVFKTVFHFDRQDVYGLLFLVTGGDSPAWIKSSVATLLEGLG
jgi:Chemotaxis protein CheC, inhibitor of MCP methylation